MAADFFASGSVIIGTILKVVEVKASRWAELKYTTAAHWSQGGRHQHCGFLCCGMNRPWTCDLFMCQPFQVNFLAVFHGHKWWRVSNFSNVTIKFVIIWALMHIIFYCSDAFSFRLWEADSYIRTVLHWKIFITFYLQK